MSEELLKSYGLISNEEEIERLQKVRKYMILKKNYFRF